MSSRAIKRAATVILDHRETFHCTRHTLLTSTANDLYDGLIKPMAKYCNIGNAFSRYGIDEDSWKLIQKEIKSRPVTDEEKAIDGRIIAEIQEGMREGGCDEEDIARVR